MEDQLWEDALTLREKQNNTHTHSNTRSLKKNKTVLNER